jgi:hypothetical protein
MDMSTYLLTVTSLRLLLLLLLPLFRPRISPMYLVSHLAVPQLGALLLGDAGEASTASDTGYSRSQWHLREP